MMTWNTTVATAGASFGTANTVSLATVGPFAVTGYCYLSGGTTYAETYVTTSEDGASLNDYDASQYLSGNFNVASGPELVGYGVNDGGASQTDWYGPNDGSFAATNAAGTTVINGSPNVGTYLQGPSGPACSFSGYLVKPIAG
jgi:hypothetical protein